MCHRPTVKTKPAFILTRRLALASTCLVLPLFLSGCATKAMIQRARGTAIEKHGVAGTVQTKPSPWHYGLVPFASIVDVVLSPLQIAALIAGVDDDEEKAASEKRKHHTP
jgi:hypothetical protein